MAQFKGISYRDDHTLAIGAGCLFGDVYRDEALKKACRNIVGGEDPVGVSGWLLGGGYSMKTNQFGLGIDNVEAYKVVVPGRVDEDARLVTVKRDDQEEDKTDLFWALRVGPSRVFSCVYILFIRLVQGGGNNFGIVTEFTLATHVQGRQDVSSS
jgi:FAD/FMN-containing dehydrogenase